METPAQAALFIGEQCPCGSGHLFTNCHGAATRPSQEQIDQMRRPQDVVMGKPGVSRRLDLACGQRVKDGFEGVDIVAGPGTTHVFDLLSYPWPIETDSVFEIFCSHFVEHIPLEFVDEHGRAVRQSAPGARDAFFAFFDECYRVLCDDGLMTVVAPASCSDRAWQDPTHRRTITSETFHYLNRDYRKAGKLDHYNVTCHFTGGYAPAMDPEMGLRHEMAGKRMIRHERNWVIDWHAFMRVKKS